MQDDPSGAPVIIFDECHKAKNLVPEGGALPSLTGFAVDLLQRLLPTACVVYSSATGVSEPRNMAYMTRLGEFGYGRMSGLVKMMHSQKEQLAVSELFACGLKAAGIYVARCAPARLACPEHGGIHVRLEIVLAQNA